MPILKLLAQLGLDKTGFDAALASADKSVAKFGKGISGKLAGAFSAAAVVAYGRAIINLGSDVKTMADRLGVSVDAVQEFGMAAKISGGDFSTFADALEKLRVSSVKSAANGENPLAMFGITMAELKSGDAAGVLKKLSVALQDFNGSAEQTKALREVFGRGAGGVVSMLQNLPDVAGAARLTETEASLLDRAGDKLTLLWNKLLVIGAKAFLVPEEGLQKGTPKAKARVAFPPDIDVGASERAEAHMATQDRILRIEKELEEVSRRNEFSQMSKEEQLLRLEQEREAILKRMAKSEEERAQKALELAKNEADIISVSEAGKLKSGMVESSELGRIGAFSGPAANVASELRQLSEKMSKIHEVLAQKGIKVRDVIR